MGSQKNTSRDPSLTSSVNVLRSKLLRSIHQSHLWAEVSSFSCNSSRTYISISLTFTLRYYIFIHPPIFRSPRVFYRRYCRVPAFTVASRSRPLIPTTLTTLFLFLFLLQYHCREALAQALQAQHWPEYEMLKPGPLIPHLTLHAWVGDILCNDIYADLLSSSRQAFDVDGRQLQMCPRYSTHSAPTFQNRSFTIWLKNPCACTQVADWQWLLLESRAVEPRRVDPISVSCIYGFYTTWICISNYINNVHFIEYSSMPRPARLHSQQLWLLVKKLRNAVFDIQLRVGFIFVT